MFRRLSVLVVLVLLTVALPSPAAATSDWDPNDVKGPFDLRRAEATYSAEGDLRIKVSFYDGFTPSALPTQGDGPFQAPSRIHVRLTDFLEGWFLRGRQEASPSTGETSAPVVANTNG